MELEGHLFDASGNEVVIPEGHLPIQGKFSSCTLPVDQYDAKFVFKPPLQSEIVGTHLKDKIALVKRLLG